MNNNKRRKIKMNKCPEENFLLLKYLCNIQASSIRNNTQKLDNKTWTNIQQKII